LCDAATAISEGEYHIDIPVKARDETKQLASSLTSMSYALGNFECFTNRAIALRSLRGELKPGGEYKNATVLFSDIRSFTAISEKLSAEEVVHLVNSYMDFMLPCVIQTGGVVSKLIGDAVMAVWGADEALDAEESALSGVLCALAMRASLQCFNARRAEAGAPPLRIGCGINSGSLIAGLTGSGDELEFSVIGDTVHLADRLETFNKSFGTEILISEETYRRTERFFVCTQMPDIGFLGKRARVYAVINVKDPSAAARLTTILGKIAGVSAETAGHYAGDGGPFTLDELRERLGIPPVNLDEAAAFAEESKTQLA
jgi:adenylate cyclase